MNGIFSLVNIRFYATIHLGLNLECVEKVILQSLCESAEQISHLKSILHQMTPLIQIQPVGVS